MDQEAERFLSFLTTPSPTVDSLGISDELKDKLEDVLIPEQQFTLGRMLGKGTWAVQALARVEFAVSRWIWVSSYKQDMLIDS